MLVTGGVVVIVRIFWKAASPMRIGLSELLCIDEAFFTAGMMMAPEDVLAMDEAVRIRDVDVDDRSIADV